MDWATIMTSDFWFGFVGALVVTAYLTKGLISFVMDKSKRTNLKRWEKIGCTLFAAMLVAVAWGMYADGTIVWSSLFANTLVYTFASSFAYENIVKLLDNKGQDSSD